MLTLNDGRSELWQWDTGRQLTVDADCSQVHFSNKVFGRSIDVDVVDGTAIIPDTLLQTDKDLTVWAFVGTSESGYTKISKVFKVNKRNKPSDYVFTPTDQTTLDDILDRIEELEERPSGGNGGITEEVDPTVPDWAKQPQKPTYTAAEVGALPETTKIPSTAEDVGALPADEVKWRKLRSFAVPADTSTDTGGIEWTTKADGGVIGFEFDTDYEGNAFECSELSIITFGKCADTGTIDFLGNGTSLCKNLGYQNAAERYGWGELHKRNGIWRWIGAWAASMRVIYDTQPVKTTGFVGGSVDDIDSFSKFGIIGTAAFNVGYQFDIWGR